MIEDNFIITEVEPILSENGTYFIGENIDFFFSIKNRFAYVANVILKTDFPEEIKLHNRFIGKDSTSKIKVSLEPSSTGEKSFKILVNNKKRKSLTLEKKFNVKLKSTFIETKINKQLPASMKLGQKSGVIFLFTNRGSQPVTDISIEIKQTEVTS